MGININSEHNVWHLNYMDFGTGSCVIVYPKPFHVLHTGSRQHQLTHLFIFYILLYQ